MLILARGLQKKYVTTTTSMPRISATPTVKNYEKSSSEGSDPLFLGVTGFFKYITRPDHIVNGSIRIKNGGIGGAHPYLNGVTIPSYLGATNPNDNAWVRGLLEDVRSVTWLKTQSSDEPTWVEGGVSSPGGQPPSNPPGLRVVQESDGG